MQAQHEPGVRLLEHSRISGSELEWEVPLVSNLAFWFGNVGLRYALATQQQQLGPTVDTPMGRLSRRFTYDNFQRKVDDMSPTALYSISRTMRLHESVLLPHHKRAIAKLEKTPKSDQRVGEDSMNADSAMWRNVS